jgi:hypothetical protein
MFLIADQEIPHGNEEYARQAPNQGVHSKKPARPGRPAGGAGCSMMKGCDRGQSASAIPNQIASEPNPAAGQFANNPDDRGRCS